MEVLPDFSEITDNFERLQSDVRSSFRFFGKDEDKGWWESFFTNYDEETEGKLYSHLEKLCILIKSYVIITIHDFCTRLLLT